MVSFPFLQLSHSVSVDSVIDRWDLRGEIGSSVCPAPAPAFTLQDIYRDSSGAPAALSDGISLTSLAGCRLRSERTELKTMNVSQSWES